MSENKLHRKYNFHKCVVWLYFSVIFTAYAEIEISGYYKNIFLRSKTVITPQQDYLLDLNRLRLQLNGDITDNINFNIEYDNEILLGSYLGTQQFSIQKSLSDDGYFNLQNNYVDNSSVYARQLLYRGYITSTFSDVDIRIGRQRIAWGTAFLWNPMDVLNPFNPLQLERGERPGVDATLVDWNIGALSRLSLVQASYDRGKSTSSAVRFRSNFNGFDVSILSGDFKGQRISGLDFSGQIGQVGLRGEFTRTQSKAEGDYYRAVVGADYTFPNSLFFALEYYYNGQGTTSISQYQFSKLFSGSVQSLAQHYTGVFMAGDITPLLRLENVIIMNLDDNSYFLYPALNYSVTEDISASIGVQLFSGKAGTEFAAINNLYFGQLQWFF